MIPAAGMPKVKLNTGTFESRTASACCSNGGNEPAGAAAGGGRPSRSCQGAISLSIAAVSEEPVPS
jgi:hypothetical protein